MYVNVNAFRADKLRAVTHPAWIEIDLDALIHNAGVLRRAIPSHTALGLLVKANAYGHGLEMAARAAVLGDADQLIVANLDEALAVRRAGLAAPVLVAYAIPPDGIAEAAQAELELSVTGLDTTRRTLEAWAQARARGIANRLDLHVEVDTGMGRGGVAPQDLVEVIRQIDAQPDTNVVGIWSHLANGRDPATSREQTQRFEAAVAQVAATGRPVPRRHLVATEAIFAETAPPYEMARVGLGFYGLLGRDFEPEPDLLDLAAELRPAMTAKARPVRLEWMPAGATVGYGQEWTADRRSLIATLPIGYADGWSRAYWPGAAALVRGRRVPLIGRVSMDSVCADVTDVGEITPDDEFVLLGAQGGEHITANDLARLHDSIPNEVLCAFGARIERIYIGESAAIPAGQASQ